MRSEVTEASFAWTRRLGLPHPVVQAGMYADEGISSINQVRPAADFVEKLIRGRTMAGGEI